MSVKFRVQQPFNFQTYSYLIVFDTFGDGLTPRANGTTTGFPGYSFGIVVSGNGSGTPTANLYQYARPNGPGTAPQLFGLQPTAQQFIFYPNTNGQGTEFTVTFQRSLFAGISFTATPSASPTSSSSTGPTPSPCPTSSTSPCPSPSGSTSPGDIWHFNFFTATGSVAQQNLLPVDSLGSVPSGANDTSYTSPALDTTTSFTLPIVPITGPHAPEGPDTITGGEIDNNP